MLRHISSLYEYRDFLDFEKTNLNNDQLKRLSSPTFKRALHKLRKLDVKLAEETLFEEYSEIGRPAIDPGIILRSFILFQHLGYTSLLRWCEDLNNDRLLQYLIGTYSPPGKSTHYDFINRLTHTDPKATDALPKDFFTKPNKKKKPKSGEKLVNYTKEDTKSLADKYKEGAVCDRNRYSYNLQRIFNSIAVIPSIDQGLISNNKLIISGDGSSLHIHASPNGKEISTDDPINTHHYTAPEADWGWDSDLESFYFGYTFYNISSHNPQNKLDLPLFITIEKASRHDAITSISAMHTYLILIQKSTLNIYVLILPMIV